MHKLTHMHTYKNTPLIIHNIMACDTYCAVHTAESHSSPQQVIPSLFPGVGWGLGRLQTWPPSLYPGAGESSLQPGTTMALAARDRHLTDKNAHVQLFII